MKQIDLKDQYFGTEIEMTGISRYDAAVAIGRMFGTEPYHIRSYDSWCVKDSDGKTWKFSRDSSIDCERLANGTVIDADGDYSTEMVSPKLEYSEMGKLQEVVRCVKNAGAFVNSSCGMHVHVDASNHTPRSLKNALTIMYCKEDILFKALNVQTRREDEYDFALTRPVVGAGCHNVINALYLGAKKTLNGLARVLGREEPYELEKPVFAYRRAFYRKETGLLADSETSSHTSLHSNVYALYFGLLEEAEEAPVIEFLEKRGFSCGVMLSYYLLLALARRGRYESVYRLLLNDSDHGWCNMLREGATTCFEAWGKDQKWNTSLCHPWASAPVPVILEEIAGIHLSPEGGCDFAPHIPKEVDYFHASVRVRGKMYTVTKQDGEIHAAIDGIEQSKEM